ncbi:MAG TPA: hypothetical protein VLK25_05190, partial [Allosphingosinicella sp.]|nr:hypothetical protein [Allosphingosinicella sp.]
DYRLTVTNDRPVPIDYEAAFNRHDDQRLRPREAIGSRDGVPLWAVTIPANGSASLRYRIREVGNRDES